MLNIYAYRDAVPQGYDIADNIENEFFEFKMTGSKLDRLFIRNIEHGEYNDSTSFIDRLGYKLPIALLSTGCKAAIVVAHNPDKVVDLKECGINAINSIISHCTEGNIIAYFTEEDEVGTESEDGTLSNDIIDVIFDGVHFTSAKELKDYFWDVWLTKLFSNSN